MVFSYAAVILTSGLFREGGNSITKSGSLVGISRTSKILFPSDFSSVSNGRLKFPETNADVLTCGYEAVRYFSIN